MVGAYRIDAGLLIGLGPLAGAIAGCLVLRQRVPSLFGHRRSIGIAALLVPIALTAFTGYGALASAGVAGLVFGASVIVYCLCEEAGWRGFLTPNLHWLGQWQGDLATGALWFAWHFTFMPEMFDPAYVPGFTAAIIAGSFGLAEARRRTGGFALAVGWHAAIKLFAIGPLAFALIAFMALLTWKSKKPDMVA